MPGMFPVDQAASRHNSSHQQSAQSNHLSSSKSSQPGDAHYFDSDDEASFDDNIRAAVATEAIVNKDNQQGDMQRRQPKFKEPEKGRHMNKSHQLSIKEHHQMAPPVDDRPQNNFKPLYGMSTNVSKTLKVSQSVDAVDKAIQLPSMFPTHLDRVMSVRGAGKSSGTVVRGATKADIGTGTGTGTGTGADVSAAEAEVGEGINPTLTSAFDKKKQRSASPGPKFGTLSSLVNAARALMTFSVRSPSQFRSQSRSQPHTSKDITQSAPSSPARQRPLSTKIIPGHNANASAQSAPSSPREQLPVAAVAPLVVSPPAVAPTSRQLARPFSRNPSRQNSHQNSRSTSPAVVRINAAGMATSVPALTLPQLPLTYYLTPVLEQDSGSFFSASDVSSLSHYSRSSALAVPGSMAAPAVGVAVEVKEKVEVELGVGGTVAPAIQQSPVSAPVAAGHDVESPSTISVPVPAALAVAGRAPTLRDLLQIGFVLSPRDTPRDDPHNNRTNDDDTGNNDERAAAAPSPSPQPPHQPRPPEQHPRHPRHPAVPVVARQDSSSSGEWKQLAVDLQVGKSASAASEY